MTRGLRDEDPSGREAAHEDPEELARPLIHDLDAAAL